MLRHNNYRHEAAGVAVPDFQTRTHQDLMYDNALNSLTEDKHKRGWYLSWLRRAANSLL
jgi:hypothetical protein